MEALKMVDAQTQQLFQRLNNAYGSLMRSPEVRAVRQGTAIWNFMNEVGQVIRQYSTMPQQAQQPAAQAMDDARRLVSLAQWLDEAGAHAMADVVDEAAGLVREAFVDVTPYPERPGTYDKTAQGHMRDALDAMEQARVLLVDEAFPSYSKAQTRGLQGEPWDAMEQDFHRLKRDLVELKGKIKDAFEQSGAGMGENADDTDPRTVQESTEDILLEVWSHLPDDVRDRIVLGWKRITRREQPDWRNMTVGQISTMLGTMYDKDEFREDIEEIARRHGWEGSLMDAMPEFGAPQPEDVAKLMNPEERAKRWRQKTKERAEYWRQRRQEAKRLTDEERLKLFHSFNEEARTRMVPQWRDMTPDELVRTLRAWYPESFADDMVRQAASPYTHFYHFFYLVKSLFNSFQTVVMREDPKQLDKAWLENFGREWQRLLQRYARFAENPKYKYSRHASLAGRLVAMAQLLDDRGEHARADLMDATADYVRRFADDGQRQEQQDSSPFKPLNETPLSTRYCPDHIGVQTSRISQHAVQCPLDGRVYNYEAGYVDYDGQKVPGGSVAAQTPSVMPYGIPNRMYDSRQSVINTMN
jgi:hypothetical protein